MTAQIINGKELAASIKEEIKTRISERAARSLTIPGLATVLVGNDPASRTYVTNKIKTTAALGIRSFSYELPEDCTQEELEALIAKLNEDPEVHGILVQLPLPEQLSEERVLLAISPKKDVDGFHPNNVSFVGECSRGANERQRCGNE